MDTTLAPVAMPDAAAPRTPQPLERLMAMPLRSKIGLGLAAGLLAALIASTAFIGSQPDWKVLYANLGDKDGGQVIAALSQMNVPHKFTEGGAAIMVPAPQVHEVRLKLASQGLPKGGAVGFELMENQKFGTTQFQERINFQRGLEGELSRSIMALAAVESARVHLALPQQTAFLREAQKPSASVLLTLHAGRVLDRSQIAGIVHLVAASVPEMQTKAVSVVDQTGALLSEGSDGLPNGLDARQTQYVRQTEQHLASRILAIIEPIVGPGNVKAQVTADVDFTQSESTAELYTPNQGGGPQAVRSQHLSETPNGAANVAGGIPGALTNQPPPNATAPVNGAAQSLTAGGAPAGAAAGAKRDAVTNYEVDKTIRVVRSASGQVRRLNAAVVVNQIATTGPDGKTVATPLSAEQMAQINALVREAVGFSTERGDSVNVVNAPFNVAVQPPAPVLPLWQQPETVQMARSLAPWIALPLLGLIILLGLVRPALKAARKSDAEALAQQRLLSTTVQDAVELPMPGAPGDATVTLAGADPGVPLLPTAEAAVQQARTRQLDVIRQLARDNPATVANVVRNWVSQPTT